MITTLVQFYSWTIKIHSSTPRIYVRDFHIQKFLKKQLSLLNNEKLSNKKIERNKTIEICLGYLNKTEYKLENGAIVL